MEELVLDFFSLGYGYEFDRQKNELTKNIWVEAGRKLSPWFRH